MWPTPITLLPHSVQSLPNHHTLVPLSALVCLTAKDKWKSFPGILSVIIFRRNFNRSQCGWLSCLYKFPLTPMGSSLPGLRTRDPPLGPHRRERKFYGACVCRVTFKHLPQPLRSHIRSFGTLGQLLKFSKKNF